MCVDVSHLVLETLGDSNDQVVDESSDCAEGSDVLAGTVVKLDVDDILLWVREVDSQMVQVLCEFACNPPSTPAPLSQMCDYFIPLGPVTVTSLDLMVTLTVRKSLISICSSSNAVFSGCPQILHLPSQSTSHRTGEPALTTLWHNQLFVAVNVLHRDLFCRGLSRSLSARSYRSSSRFWCSVVGCFGANLKNKRAKTYSLFHENLT